MHPQLGGKKVCAGTDYTLVKILEALSGPRILGTLVGRSSGSRDAVGQEEACSLARWPADPGLL